MNTAAEPAAPMTDVPRAEAAVAAARSAESDARARHEAAASVHRIALGMKATAEQLAADTRAALEAATARRAEAEAAWLPTAAPDLWPAVEAARTAEAQASIRAGSAASALTLADAEASIAARRAEAAAEALRRASYALTAAENELRGARTSAAAMDAAEARRVGERQRQAEEAAKARAAFGAELAAAAAPPLARYLGALGALRAAEEELARIIPEMAAKGKRIAGMAGDAFAPPADLDLRAGVGPILREAATRRYGRDPWGEGAKVRTGSPAFVRERERAGDANAFHDLVDAALRTPVAGGVVASVRAVGGRAGA